MESSDSASEITNNSPSTPRGSYRNPPLNHSPPLQPNSGEYFKPQLQNEQRNDGVPIVSLQGERPALHSHTSSPIAKLDVRKDGKGDGEQRSSTQMAVQRNGKIPKRRSDPMILTGDGCSDIYVRTPKISTPPTSMSQPARRIVELNESGNGTAPSILTDANKSKLITTGSSPAELITDRVQAQLEAQVKELRKVESLLTQEEDRNSQLLRKTERLEEKIRLMKRGSREDYEQKALEVEILRLRLSEKDYELNQLSREKQAFESHDLPRVEPTQNDSILAHDSGYGSREGSLPANSKEDISAHSGSSVSKVDDFEKESDSGDVQSILSVPDDIQSQITTHRTQQEITASEQLGELLARNEELNPLYQIALLKISKERLVENLRRLLKQYYLDLSSTAQTNLEKAAVQLLRSRWNRIRISRQIANIIDPDTADEPEQEISEIPDKKAQLEFWLANNARFRNSDDAETNRPQFDTAFS
jgi:hypothetical protein